MEQCKVRKTLSLCIQINSTYKTFLNEATKFICSDEQMATSMILSTWFIYFHTYSGRNIILYEILTHSHSNH
jgi:hypothetical protein